MRRPWLRVPRCRSIQPPVAIVELFASPVLALLAVLCKHWSLNRLPQTPSPRKRRFVRFTQTPTPRSLSGLVLFTQPTLSHFLPPKCRPPCIARVALPGLAPQVRHLSTFVISFWAAMALKHSSSSAPALLPVLHHLQWRGFLPALASWRSLNLPAACVLLLWGSVYIALWLEPYFRSTEMPYGLILPQINSLWLLLPGVRLLFWAFVIFPRCIPPMPSYRST